MLFRVVDRLYRGGGKFMEVGTVTDLAWLDDVQARKLLATGAVSPVSVPPLAAIPGWSRRARKLSHGGIIDLVGVAEADTGTLAALGRVSEGVAEDWKEQARALLFPPTGAVDQGGDPATEE